MDTDVPPVIEWFAEWKVQGHLQMSRLTKKVLAVPLVQSVASQASSAFTAVKASISSLTAAPVTRQATFKVPGESRQARPIALPASAASRKAAAPSVNNAAANNAPNQNESAEDKMRFLQEQLAFLKAQMEALAAMKSGAPVPAEAVEQGGDQETPQDDSTPDATPDEVADTPRKSKPIESFASPARMVPGTPSLMSSPPASVLKSERRRPGAAILQSPPRSSSIGRDELVPGAPLISARGPGSMAAPPAVSRGPPVACMSGPPCMPPSLAAGPPCMPPSLAAGPPCMPPSMAAGPPCMPSQGPPVSKQVAPVMPPGSAPVSAPMPPADTTVRRPSAADLMAGGMSLRKVSSDDSKKREAVAQKGPLSSNSFMASLTAAAAAKSNKMQAESVAQDKAAAPMPLMQLPNGQKVFTRKLVADDEEIDFATEIKISAKTKLRRVPNQQRSPGGTPMRGNMLSPEKDSFRKALLSKFKNTRGDDAKAFKADSSKRQSLDRRLDEERARTQSEVTEGEWEEDKENVEC